LTLRDGRLEVSAATTNSLGDETVLT